MAFELLVDFPFFFSKSRSANPSSAIASPICSGATAVELAHAAKAAPDGQRNKKMPEIDATKEKQNEIKQIGNPSEEKKNARPLSRGDHPTTGATAFLFFGVCVS